VRNVTDKSEYKTVKVIMGYLGDSQKERTFLMVGCYAFPAIKKKLGIKQKIGFGINPLKKLPHLGWIGLETIPSRFIL